MKDLLITYKPPLLNNNNNKINKLIQKNLRTTMAMLKDLPKLPIKIIMKEISTIIKILKKVQVLYLKMRKVKLV